MGCTLPACAANSWSRFRSQLPAKPEDYIIRYYTPGQEPPVIPKEVQTFDANARGWMSDAGLPRELGNSLVNTLSNAIQHTHTMTAEQRESYKDAENAKLKKLFGPDWHDTKLKPVSAMIHELDQKRPGLKVLIREHAIDPGRWHLSRAQGALSDVCWFWDHALHDQARLSTVKAVSVVPDEHSIHVTAGVNEPFGLR